MLIVPVAECWTLQNEILYDRIDLLLIMKFYLHVGLCIIVIFQYVHIKTCRDESDLTKSIVLHH